ncbi:MAG: hypothetical protein WCH99_04750 [Verrucomicrobiota bacterium]
MSSVVRRFCAHRMTSTIPTSEPRATARKQHLYFFRPGEAARSLPRWQFSLDETGRCGAMLTYPIVGMPWRHCRTRSMEATLDAFTTATIFAEVASMPATAPDQCLPTEVLWSDSTEKCNGITRDRATDTLCLTLGISDEHGAFQTYFSMREDSPVLLGSVVHRVVTGLLAPYVGLFPI